MHLIFGGAQVGGVGGSKGRPDFLCDNSKNECSNKTRAAVAGRKLSQITEAISVRPAIFRCSDHLRQHVSVTSGERTSISKVNFDHHQHVDVK